MSKSVAPLSAAAMQAAYAALRQGGSPRQLACAQLGLEGAVAARLEALLRARVARGEGEETLPKFALHRRHVAAVMGQGGFPALSERRSPRSEPRVCLPIIRPAADRARGAEVRL